ncbi:MAG TPA: MBL fold metallo-hydrolase [Oligoflexia bacterium]|nr:MBL fold metallo-hydrolase [Oligoflexia bacterium]HMP48250.1 MBL fold metallo-hydrolase [Oligoflexia bacterium]
MLNIGPYRVYTHIVDYFKLDGGSMFGSVPKVLWERYLPADSLNRIPLCSRVMIIESPGRKILIDTGCGLKWDEKRRAQYDIKSALNNYSEDSILSKRISGVTDVVLTHLHFDHAGGVSYFNGSVLKLSFPDAKHYVSKENFDQAMNPGQRERGSYFPEHLSILQESDLVLTKDEFEILPGIRFYTLYGHTRGMQIVIIEEGGMAKVAFLADLVPTHHHLQLPFIMGYDMCAEKTLAERLRFYPRFLQDETVLIFEHDRDCAAGILGLSKDKYMLEKQIVLDCELA